MGQGEEPLVVCLGVPVFGEDAYLERLRAISPRIEPVLLGLFDFGGGTILQGELIWELPLDVAEPENEMVYNLALMHTILSTEDARFFKFLTPFVELNGISVLNGDESPKFLGKEQAKWGGTKNINTESGRGLAEEIGEVVVNALTRQGITASALQPTKGADMAEMLAFFQNQDADRLLMLELQDWRTDVYTRVKLKWRLEAIVYDRAGNILGRSASQGNNPISRTNLRAEYTNIVIHELSNKLTNLLNERAITDALR